MRYSEILVLRGIAAPWLAEYCFLGIPLHSLLRSFAILKLSPPIIGGDGAGSGGPLCVEAES